MDKKSTGIVAYITIVGWIVAYFAGDRENAKFHLNQSLVLHLLGIIVFLMSLVLLFIPFIGWFLMTVMQLGLFLFIFWGFLEAASGMETPLPIFGGIEIYK